VHLASHQCADYARTSYAGAGEAYVAHMLLLLLLLLLSTRQK